MKSLILEKKNDIYHHAEIDVVTTNSDVVNLIKVYPISSLNNDEGMHYAICVFLPQKGFSSVVSTFIFGEGSCQHSARWLKGDVHFSAILDSEIKYIILHALLHYENLENLIKKITFEICQKTDAIPLKPSVSKKDFSLRDFGLIMNSLRF